MELPTLTSIYDTYKLAGEDFSIEGDNLNFVGYVDLDERRKLLSRAKAVFVPTIYLENFGGVNIEAQMSGTPVITTDFGAFPEVVLQGITGYRCRTLNQFVWAARNIERIKPSACRHWAMENYSMHKVKWMFQDWFSSLYQLYLSSQDEGVPGWHFISEKVPRDWLFKSYPREEKT